MLVTKTLSRIALIVGLVLVAGFGVPAVANAADPAKVTFTTELPDGAPTTCTVTAAKPRRVGIDIAGTVTVQCTRAVMNITEYVTLFERYHSAPITYQQGMARVPSRGYAGTATQRPCQVAGYYTTDGRVTLQIGPSAYYPVHVVSPSATLTCG